MEDHILIISSTAIVSIITALGIPQLWKHLTDRKKIESDSQCKEEIQFMELRLQQLVTGVDMMLTIIETEFDDSSKYHNVIEKVKQILADTKNV